LKLRSEITFSSAPFHLPITLALGFPIAMVLAWAFDLTPEGLKRTEVVDVAPTRRSAQKDCALLFTFLVLLIVAILEM
jgi:hypothetical protein